MRLVYPTHTKELDLPLCLLSGQVFRFRRVAEDVWEGGDGPYHYRLSLPADLAESPWATATGMGDPRGNISHRQYDLLIESESPEAFLSLIRAETSLAEIHARVGDLAPTLRPILGTMPGLRLLRRADFAETALTFACTANNHLPRIEAMVRWFCLQTGGNRFPSAAVVAEMSEGCLREAGFGYRAKTIPALATALADGSFQTGLEGLETSAARARMTTLPGIGPKLADCVLLLGGDRLDAAPLDTHVWTAYTRELRPDWLGKTLTTSRYQEASADLARRFGNLAGWAQQVLFVDQLLNWRRRKTTKSSGKPGAGKVRSG